MSNLNRKLQDIYTSTFGNDLTKSQTFSSSKQSKPQRCLTYSNEFTFTSVPKKDKRQKTQSFYNQKVDKSNMELLVPLNSFTYSKHGSEKIQRKLESLGKVYNKENVPSVGFRNRPVVNLDKPRLDLNPKYVIEPSATRRVLVTPYRRKNKKVVKGSKFDEYKRNSFTMNNRNKFNKTLL